MAMVGEVFVDVWWVEKKQRTEKIICEEQACQC
jgi:hypothetical protein